VLLLGLLVGAVGVVLPALPAVPVALLGVVLAGWITGFERLDVGFIVWVGVLTLLAQAVDLIGTWLGSRYFGARRPGVIGGIIGAVVGLIVLPPWGLLLGALVGASLGEAAAGRPAAEAVKAGVGAMLGTLSGVVGKAVILLLVGVMSFVRLLGG
jgi:uncharacterized protein